MLLNCRDSILIASGRRQIFFWRLLSSRGRVLGQASITGYFFSFSTFDFLFSFALQFGASAAAQHQTRRTSPSPQLPAGAGQIHQTYLVSITPNIVLFDLFHFTLFRPTIPHIQSLKMSSPPPYQTPNNPLKRPSISSSASQPLGKKPRMHPLRQTSFPTGLDVADRSFGATSDAGSVTGSFTGSIGGASADGVFAGAARGKKRGRKSKAEKEREREREDAMGSRAGDARLGSVDAEGSVRGGMGGGGGGGDGADDDEDDDEDELLGREEGTTDTEAEKKNLAYVVSPFVCFVDWKTNLAVCTGSWLMLLIHSNPSDMIFSREQSFAKNLSAVSLTMRFHNLSRRVWLPLSTVLRRCLPVR